ncbi:P1 family peptidase [Actinoplanes sp. NPDC051851]|uniref:P1 family peptidase n=1 Tax=Actinoplanes sp. NPDC051851 TaxID=3154753 RepID=UPI003414652E
MTDPEKRPQLLTSFAGHWDGDGTGVTVIVPPPGTVASGEVRGGAPATREFPLLDPTRLVDRVDAVVLSGGSAFGLAAADGVAGLLRERGRGFATPFGPVPIVVGMSIFDASVASRPPDAGSGRAAALAALSGAPLRSGTHGAGTGAVTGKWRSRLDPGGAGVAEGRSGSARVAAIAVVNAWGDVLGADGRPLFAPGAPESPGPPAPPMFGAGSSGVGSSGAGSSGAGSSGAGSSGVPPGSAMGNTTIAVVVTDAKLGKTDCFLLAQSGHTGFARALHPAHSRYDGDAVVALASGEVTSGYDLDHLRAVASDVMAAAIRAAVTG